MRPLTILGCVLMFVSTILLYPGMFGMLTRYEVYLEIFGVKLEVLNAHRSFVGLLHMMSTDKAVVAVACMTFFGVVLPLIKIILFGCWVFSGATGDRYIKPMKGLSKWTGVDAVVEAFAVGSLLKMPNTYTEHGIGFASFTGYVVLSCLAFLCLPGEINFVEEPPNAFHLKLCEKFRSPRIRKMSLAATLVAFLCVLSAAGTNHSVRIWVPKDALQWGVGHRLLRRDELPQPLQTLTEPMLNRIEEAIANLVDVEAMTSVSGCVRRTLSSSNLYTVFGSSIIFICVCLIPVAYAVINTAYALALTELPEDELKSIADAADRGENTAPWPAMTRLRAFLWDLSMLDVCAIAFPIVTGVPNDTLKSELLPGYGFLIGAAILWHVQNFLCRTAQLSVLTDGVQISSDGNMALLQAGSSAEASQSKASSDNQEPKAIYI